MLALIETQKGFERKKMVWNSTNKTRGWNPSSTTFVSL